jgi:uncharacterized membrane protein
VERMILFSDAVFAIVITLMAIEIKLPETHGNFDDQLVSNLFHIAPLLLAYAVSFFFVGSIWYQHLGTFSLVRDYDAGLIVRNLLLLFFVGLFPFSANMLSHADGSLLAFIIYMMMILLCMGANFLLMDYILIKKPELRVSKVDKKFFEKHHKGKAALFAMFTMIPLIAATSFLISNPYLKNMSILWMTFLPLFIKGYMRVFKQKEA